MHLARHRELEELACGLGEPLRPRFPSPATTPSASRDKYDRHSVWWIAGKEFVGAVVVMMVHEGTTVALGVFPRLPESGHGEGFSRLHDYAKWPLAHWGSSAIRNSRRRGRGSGAF